MAVPDIRVGIDPSSNRSGVAIMEAGRYSKLLMLDFFELDALIEQLPTNTVYYVENPNYMRAPHRQLIDEREAGKLRNMSAAVARCRQTAILIVQNLEHKGRRVELVKPQRGVSKRAKQDKAWFNLVTGWGQRSNKDTRDAAMLIFGFLRQENNRGSL